MLRNFRLGVVKKAMEQIPALVGRASKNTKAVLRVSKRTTHTEKNISPSQKSTTSKISAETRSLGDTYQFLLQKTGESTANKYSRSVKLLTLASLVLTGYQLSKRALAEGVEDDNVKIAAENRPKTLKDLMYEGMDDVLTAKDKRLDLIVGRTNSGKTTLLNYLIGYELEFYTDDNILYKIRIKNPGDDRSKFGRINIDNLEPETQQPRAFKSLTDDNAYWCDCPGFQDTRTLYQDWTIISTQLAIRSAEEVRSIVLVLDYNELFINFGKLAVGVAEDLSLLTNGEKRVLDSTILVFTKTEVKDKKTASNDDKTRGAILHRLEGLVKTTLATLQAQKIQYEAAKKALNVVEGAAALIDKSRRPTVSHDLEELGKRITASNNTLRGLYAIKGCVKNNRFVMANVVDDGETRNTLKNKINSLPKGEESLHKEDLFRAEEDSIWGGFQKVFHEEVLVQTESFRKVDQLIREIKQFEERQETLKGEILSCSDIRTYGVTETIRNTLNTEIENNDRKLTEIENSINKLDAENESIKDKKDKIDTEDLQVWKSSKPFKGNVWRIPILRNWSWSRHDFVFTDIPTATYTEDKTCKDGEFSAEIKEKSSYSVTFKSEWGQDGEAIVKIHVPRKSIEKNAADISNAIQEMDVRKTKISTLRTEQVRLLKRNQELTKILNGEDFAFFKEQIAVLTKEEDQVKKDLILKRRALEDANQALSCISKKHSILFEVITIMAFNSSHTISFKEYYSLFLTRAAQTMQQKNNASEMTEVLKFYNKALCVNPNNSEATHEKAKFLLSHKQPIQAVEVLFRDILDNNPDIQEERIDAASKADTAFCKPLDWDILNPYIYAVMSELSYYDTETAINNDENVNKIWEKLKKERGWEIYATVADNNGYYAMIFRHQGSKKIVIAHRGTYDKKTILADVEMIRSQEPKIYTEGAKILSEHYLNKYGAEYEITHTGHSLGGTLATLCAVNFDSSATTFDALGSFSILVNHHSKASIEKLDKRYSITTYVAPFNIVNTFARHIGQTFYVPALDNDIDKLGLTITIAQKLYQFFVGSRPEIIDVAKGLTNFHRMPNIRGIFDETSGSPVLMFLVKSWPSHIDEFIAAIAAFNSKQLNIQTALFSAIVPSKKLIKTLQDVAGCHLALPNLYSIDLSQVDEQIQKIITAYYTGDKSLAEKYNIDTRFFKVCRLTEITSQEDKQNRTQYLLIDEQLPFKAEQLKLYLQRKVVFYKQSERLYRQALLAAPDDAISGIATNPNGLFGNSDTNQKNMRDKINEEEKTSQEPKSSGWCSII